MDLASLFEKPGTRTRECSDRIRRKVYEQLRVGICFASDGRDQRQPCILHVEVEPAVERGMLCKLQSFSNFIVKWSDRMRKTKCEGRTLESRKNENGRLATHVRRKTGSPHSNK